MDDTSNPAFSLKDKGFWPACSKGFYISLGFDWWRSISNELYVQTHSKPSQSNSSSLFARFPLWTFLMVLHCWKSDWHSQLYITSTVNLWVSLPYAKRYIFCGWMSCTKQYCQDGFSPDLFILYSFGMCLRKFILNHFWRVPKKLILDFRLTSFFFFFWTWNIWRQVKKGQLENIPHLL